MRRHLKNHRPAFTLVELLMVVAIIGILVGLAVPAVLFALQRVKAGAIAMEAQSLAQAIEAYKNKVGDYPPDGSNQVVFERHYLKRFPNAMSSEFTTLYALVNSNAGGAPFVMDPPEALVFALGGFSSDPTHPFTGPGGPLFNSGTSASPIWQYNTDRNEPLFEFKQEQLTLDTSSGLALSNDEAVSGGTNDLMPCYVPRGRVTPYVYFDKRTYAFATASGMFYNSYAYGSPTTAPAHGVARPYRSDTINTRVGALSASNANDYFQFMNDKSFQLLGAGLDDHFGNVPAVRYYRYPSGDSIDFSTSIPTVGTFSRFLDDTSGNKFQHDNVANFADGVLADALTN